MKNTKIALKLLHKLLQNNQKLHQDEIDLLKKHGIELTALNEAEYSSDEFNKELSRIRNILIK